MGNSKKGSVLTGVVVSIWQTAEPEGAMQPTSASVEHKDVVIALFGGSIGIAGLLLIFQGFILSAYAALPSVTPQPRRDWFKRAVVGTLLALVIAVVSVFSSLIWLLTQDLYNATIGLFITSVGAVLVLGGVISWDLIR